MDSTDETIIELSRAKLARLILGSCAAVATGAWLLSFDMAEIERGRSFGFLNNNPLLVYGVGLLAVACFGGCGLYGLFKLFDKRPGLVLNSAGLVDNASAVAAGFIPWSEVTGSHVYQMRSARMLIIDVTDPRKYADRGGALKRALNKANLKMGGAVGIPAGTLKIDFPKLVALFDRYRRKYGAAPPGRES
jgi:hypothetical protein